MARTSIDQVGLAAQDDKRAEHLPKGRTIPRRFLAGSIWMSSVLIIRVNTALNKPKKLLTEFGNVVLPNCELAKCPHVT